MAGDDNYGRHLERGEIGDDGAEEGVHEGEGSGPGDLLVVGEEFVMHDGDEGGGGSGFLAVAAEGGLDGIKECRLRQCSFLCRVGTLIGRQTLIILGNKLGFATNKTDPIRLKYHVLLLNGLTMMDQEIQGDAKVKVAILTLSDTIVMVVEHRK
ncbi:hypothetical protein JHK87_012314 [Glycine soja]|nr:hypothetical protein JHK87_012314 [Glycine soja]